MEGREKLWEQLLENRNRIEAQLQETRERVRLGLTEVREREKRERTEIGLAQKDIERVAVIAREERGRMQVRLEESRRREMHQARERVERASAEVGGIGKRRKQATPPRHPKNSTKGSRQDCQPQWEVQYTEVSSPTIGSLAVKAQAHGASGRGFDSHLERTIFWEGADQHPPPTVEHESTRTQWEVPYVELTSSATGSLVGIAQVRGTEGCGFNSHSGSKFLQGRAEHRLFSAAQQSGTQFMPPRGEALAGRQKQKGGLGGGARSAQPPRAECKSKRGRRLGTSLEGEEGAETGERGREEPPRKRMKVDEDREMGAGLSWCWEWDKEGIG